MNIQNLVTKFQIEEKAVRAGAEERFFRICSFNLAEAGQRQMEKAAFRIRTHLQTQMDIRAVARFWEQPELCGDTLQLDDVTLRCGVFEQIPRETIKGAFVYLLTIGETDIEAEDYIMTEIYHDIWGTSYVESALEVLCRDCLESQLEADLYLSESLGPGYYGMAMDEGKKLFALLGDETAGITQKASGLLLPEKSCMGLLLVYDRPGIKLPLACENCLGVHGGCQFCEKSRTRKSK
jgi:hypothetical protein